MTEQPKRTNAAAVVQIPERGSTEQQGGKLLPCPFCGFAGSDYVGLAHVQTYGQNDHRIRCGRCRATTGPHPTDEAAITAWNTRMEAARTPAIDEGLEAILAKSDDDITGEELFQLFGKNADDSLFSRDEITKAMNYSFEQGKNHIEMLRYAEAAIDDEGLVEKLREEAERLSIEGQLASEHVLSEEARLRAKISFAAKSLFEILAALKAIRG